MESEAAAIQFLREEWNRFRFCLGPPQREREKWYGGIPPFYLERARTKSGGNIPDIEPLRSNRSIRSPNKHRMEQLHPHIMLPNQTDPRSVENTLND